MVLNFFPCLEMKKTLLVLMFLLSLILSAFSQKDYRDGYIITLSHDTIYGEIDLKSNYKNRKICEFKQEDKKIKYSPEDIRGFKIEDSKFYVSKEIELEGETQSLFVEYLLDGVVDLYYLKDFEQELYFIEKEGKLYQLKNKEVKKYHEGVNYVGNSTQYLGVLSYLFHDSPTIKDKIKNTRFTGKSLAKITEEYHHSICDDYSCIDYQRKLKGEVFVEPSFGFGHDRMKIKKSDDYAENVNPSFGINFRFKAARKHEATNLVLGVNLVKKSFDDNFYRILQVESGKTYNIDLDYTSVEVPVTYEYSFNSKEIRPFVYFGIKAAFNISSDSKITVPANKSHLEYEKSSSLPGLYYGFMAGIGTRFYLKKDSYILLKAGGEYITPFSSGDAFLNGSHVKSIKFSLGYGFLLKRKK